MGNSPLRFLDNDVAHRLNKAVRVVIEEKSRQFHIELYQSIYDYTEPYPVYHIYREILKVIFTTFKVSNF